MDKDQEILRLQRQLGETGRTINDLRDEVIKLRHRVHQLLEDKNDRIRAAYEQGKADALSGSRPPGDL